MRSVMLQINEYDDDDDNDDSIIKIGICTIMTMLLLLYHRGSIKLYGEAEQSTTSDHHTPGIKNANHIP